MSSLYDNKFVKKIYRVIPHLDIHGNLPTIMDSKGDTIFDKSFDDYYIPCGRGNAEIYFYEKGKTNDTLCVTISSISVGNSVLKALKGYVIKSVDNDEEIDIYFFDKDLPLFAKELKAKVNGAKSIPPNSPKNLPHEKEAIPTFNDYKLMPKDWWTEYSVLAQSIAKKRKLVVNKVWSTIYDEFSKIVGINIVEESLKENYKPTHYIHKSGLWTQFEKYMRDGAK